MPPEQQGEAPTAPAPAPAPFIPQAQAAAPAEDEYARPGWSWGGFMLGPFFMIGIRKYALLWLYLLMLVPVVNIFAQLGIAIFMGVKGREYAAASSTFTSREQYAGFMKAVDHAGKVMFFVVLIVLAVFLAIAAAGFGALFSSLQGGDFEKDMYMQMEQYESGNDWDMSMYE